LRSHPVAKAVAAAADGAVPLALVGRFLSLVGAALRTMIDGHPGCAVLTGHRAIAVRQHASGWRTTIVDHAGRRRDLYSRNVVTATGAHQPRARLASEQVAGVSLVARYGANLLQSGDVLSAAGWTAFAQKISRLHEPRIAIIGGSASAGAVANAVLHRLPHATLAPGAVTLLHRNPLRIFYNTAEQALAEGYTEFTSDDICPVSKRVFRFAGLRLDSRELIMRTAGLGGLAPEPRLKTHMLQPHDPQAVAILDRADIIVAAFGYRPRAIPVQDMHGVPIRLYAQRTPRAPLVDGQCRVLDESGAPLPGLFGIGLAAGFVPRGALGGEPSFAGQVNGLWLWQTDVGHLIVDGIRTRAGEECAAPAMDWDKDDVPAMTSLAPPDVQTGSRAMPL
jgi:hypothetical protein